MEERRPKLRRGGTRDQKEAAARKHKPRIFKMLPLILPVKRAFILKTNSNVLTLF